MREVLLEGENALHGAEIERSGLRVGEGDEPVDAALDAELDQALLARDVDALIRVEAGRQDREDSPQPPCGCAGQRSRVASRQASRLTYSSPVCPV